MRDSHTNQKVIISHFNTFLQVMEKQIDVTRLMKNLIYIIYAQHVQYTLRIRKDYLVNPSISYFHSFISFYET